VNPTSRVPTPSLWKRLFSLGTRKGKR
jgi:hypothetical protein